MIRELLTGIFTLIKKNVIAIKYNVNFAIMYKTIDICVYVSKKFAKKLPSVCAQDFKYSIILTHTSHLTVDLSHTPAPPHLIKTLCATTSWP